MRIISTIIAVTLLVLPLVAGAAPVGTITVPNAGDHYYWFSYADIDGEQVVTPPRAFKENKTIVDMPLVKDAVPNGRLFVLDGQTGNAAITEIEGIAEQKFEFDLKAADFDLVHRVEVVVTSAVSREPVAAAVVSLEDEAKAVRTQILNPLTLGVVHFADVPAGRVKLTVRYGDDKSTSQDVDLSLDREDAVPRLQVPIVGDVETLQAAAATDGSAEAGTPADQSPGRGLNFPVAAVGLVLLTGIVYLAVTTMRNRGAGFRQLLKRAGVDLPDEPHPSADAQPAPAAQIDPSVCQFCGGRKDLSTGECACSVGASSVSSAPGAGSSPRLIATQGVYAGGIYTLEGDTVVIGREESNTIAFPQDNTASRRHARISKVNGEFTVYDEGSSNGTFVNGVRITEQVIHPGDEIQVGNTRLRFEA